ncbi:hypothetical protein [Caloranaerobacter ferrireducens]|uniref:hypothetical protein n=1 Tax=Caloranaerobacter ferrireducens TaxID=1323370 RepID=UPI00084CF180|nr:hypothetical protein [Caloranaerobacter ferrireducens]
MLVSLKGLVLEKVQKQDKDNNKKFVLRLYQPGERVNLDVTVNQQTFSQVKEMQEIELSNVRIGTYLINGKVGMYAKQEF